jgi:cell division protein FtsW (lipid II flippase)
VKNMKLLLSGTVVVAAIFAVIPCGALAGESDVEEVDKFLCKDILRTSGDDRRNAIAFMHGYLLGKSGKNKFDKAVLAKATDDFIEACLDNTSAVAITTMEQQLK